MGDTDVKDCRGIDGVIPVVREAYCNETVPKSNITDNTKILGKVEENITMVPKATRPTGIGDCQSHIDIILILQILKNLESQPSGEVPR